MPLFRKSQPDPPQPPARLTMNGEPQVVPEAPGAMPRRNRLFVECARRLADSEAASPNAVGRPVGDGRGLEELVSVIKPVFQRDHSLIRWVAIRGAITELHVRFFEDADAAVSARKLEEAMGLEWRAGAGGQSHPDLVEPWRGEMSAREREDAIGIAGAVLTRVEDYPRYSKLPIAEVNADPQLIMIGTASALDMIAWSAIACLRLGTAQQLFSQVPEPDLLTGPGWYADPLWAKAERYWDGSDLTDRCRGRVGGGRDYQETSAPLG